jgi:hypothetical protein
VLLLLALLLGCKQGINDRNGIEQDGMEWQ